jgi:hypothetical protein
MAIAPQNIQRSILKMPGVRLTPDPFACRDMRTIDREVAL